MKLKVAMTVAAILRKHGTTVEQFSRNPRSAGVDGAKKMAIITEIRNAVPKGTTLDDIAAYINVSPSQVSRYTDK